MIFNEERKQVAIKLRDYENLRELFRESPICAFLNVLGVEGYLDWKGVCNRLADLIKPPIELERFCKVKQDYDMMEDGIPDCRVWRCSCGRAFPYWRGLKPSFCSSCGAKAVEDDS